MKQHPRRLATAIAVVAAAVICSSTVGAASPSSVPDDGLGPAGRKRIAEYQFDVHLLRVAGFDARTVDCTAPPADDLDADLVCLATVGENGSVGAIARSVEPKRYEFIAFDKLDVTELDSSPSAADSAARDQLDTFVATADDFGAFVTTNRSDITSLDSLSWNEPTATVSVVVTTSTETADDRHDVAFYLTNLVGHLWESGRPLRDPATVIHPRLEVIVDGEIYGTPYPVMLRVADFTIGFDEWLQITTGAASPVRTR